MTAPTITPERAAELLALENPSHSFWQVVSDSPAYAIAAGDYRVVQTANQNNYGLFGRSESWHGIPSLGYARLIAASPELLALARQQADEIKRLREGIEELDFLRHEGGPQSVAAMEALLRDTVLPILRRSAEDLFRCVSIRNVPSSVAPSDWRDIAEDMEAVLAVEAFVGRPDDEYGRTLNPILDARMWEAHR